MTRLVYIFLFTIAFVSHGQNNKNLVNSELNQKVAKGWNTWNTRSILSHVLLPEKYAIDLYLENIHSKKVLTEALIGRRGKGVEKVKPGLHTYDGKYTDLEIEWNHQKLRIQTTANKNDLDILITPLNVNDSIRLRVHPKMIWQENGQAIVTNTKFLLQIKTTI